jgi:hypothetical protein
VETNHCYWNKNKVCGNKNIVEGTKIYCGHKNIGCGNKNKMDVETNLWLWEQKKMFVGIKTCASGTKLWLWEQKTYGCGNKDLGLWEQKI